MSVRVFVSRDAAALALGADETALALQKAAQAAGEAIELVRIGSRGMVWLEPLVEVEVAGVRVGYGPVNAADVPALVKAGLFKGAAHALRLGAVHELPFMARQERLTFARVGVIDPLDLDQYVKQGGYAGLKRALALFADKPRYVAAQRRAMQKDFSWTKAVAAYEQLYTEAL